MLKSINAKLAVKPFLMQFSKEIKRVLENLFPEYIYYIRRLFLSYHHENILRLPKTRIKSTKMQKFNARISKHIKTTCKFSPGSSVIISSIVF